MAPYSRELKSPAEELGESSLRIIGGIVVIANFKSQET